VNSRGDFAAVAHGADHKVGTAHEVAAGEYARHAGHWFSSTIAPPHLLTSILSAAAPERYNVSYILPANLPALFASSASSHQRTQRRRKRWQTLCIYWPPPAPNSVFLQ